MTYLCGLKREDAENLRNRVGRIKFYKKMKKLFITIAFVAAAFFAQAQLYIAGNIGFDYTKNPTSSVADKLTQLEINPHVGFMFADNMGIGLAINFSMTKYSFDSSSANTNYTETLYGFTPYFRYVIIPDIQGFSLYADAKFNIAFGKHGSNEDKVTNWGISVVPGIAYNISDNIAVVADLNIFRLGFDQHKVGDNKQNHFGVGFNENTPLNIGFVYNF